MSSEVVTRSFGQLMDLCIKTIYYAGRPTARAVAESMELPFSVVETLLAFLKVGYAGPWTFELAPAASPVAVLGRAAEARQRFEQALGLNDELMSQ